MPSRYLLALAVSILSVLPANACDLCPQSGQALSREINAAKMVVFGPVTDSKLAADNINGTAELRVDAMIKADPRFKDLKSITLHKYVPISPKIKYLVFLDTPKGALDPYRGMAFESERIVKYLQDSPDWLDDKAPLERRANRLLYYFKYLNDAEGDIAVDAFKEWAQASNLEVGTVADKVSADDLRKWLMDPKTPSNRLSLYAFLLGAAGKENDAELLKRLIVTPDDRVGSALDGLLAGYIRLRPEEGWKLTEEVINDSKRPFTQKHAVLRLLRFYYGYQPEKYRARIVQCSTLMLNQADVHDLMVDQLKNWKIWDLTDQVLALFSKADAPITERAILRYALLCPQPQAKKFIEQLRKTNPKLVNQVEETLRGDLLMK